MSLAAGDKLGPYEILAPIGAGGMGEVYRARDTKLDRDVAIKVLPAALSQHPDRLARFEREAKVLATLNHPNIAMIHGLEDRAIVMELVEGPTLADRLAAGAIPVEESLKIAAQIADALEAAHEKGVVHRDLKPANVKVREDGTVKVLDFGLATAAQSNTGERSDTANSPTLTMGATEAGVILGTASYMSPEQAAGRPVDRRADIWSFGVVLWEMLTGKRLFEAESVSHTLADVLRAEIDFGKLPAATPAPVRELLKRCLDRDLKNRLQWIGEARIAIQRYLANPKGGTEVPQRAKARPTKHLWRAVAAILGVAAAALAFVHFREQPPAADVIRFQVPLPEKANSLNTMSISPDGRRLAFVTAGSDTNALWIRSLETMEARLVTSDASTGPFWSPDSRFIAFAAGDKLKKADVTGGPPQTICDIPNQLRGGSWSRDGVIVFGTSSTGLWTVPATGGTPVMLTALDASRREASHQGAVFLPDGKHFLYFRLFSLRENNGIYIGSLGAKPGQQDSRRLVAAEAFASFAPLPGSHTGHLLFIRDRTLMAQPFNPDRLELSGEAVPVVEGVGTNGARPFFSASQTAILAYLTSTGGGSTQLTWFDRQGKSLGTAGEPGIYNVVSISPDGARAAVGHRSDGQNADVWVQEFARGASTRLTSDPNQDDWPVWSPDGSQIIFSSRRNGPVDLFRKSANGAGNEEVLFKSSSDKYVQDWSRDGHFLIYSETTGSRGMRLWTLPVDGERKPVPYQNAEFSNSEGRFSPDTRFVAYHSVASGRAEIYVQTFPDPSGGKWIISKGGGTHPRWRRDGKELFYISAESKLMAVEIATSPKFKAGIPKELFAAPILGGAGASNVTRYDVSPDGQRFLINAALESAPASPPITVVVNWQAGLKK